MSPAPLQRLSFDALAVGEELVTPSYKVTLEDIAAFGEVTRDRHALHSDDGVARAAGFPRVIAHGLFGLSLMEGLKFELQIDDAISLASLGWENVRFRNPLFVEDRVHALIRVTAKRHSSRPRHGIVTENVKLIKEDQTLVTEGDHLILVRT